MPEVPDAKTVRPARFCRPRHGGFTRALRFRNGSRPILAASHRGSIAMDRDPNTPTDAPRSSIRSAVLELMAGRVAGSPLQDEAAFRAALREIVAGGRDRAAELWQLYRGDWPDPRARVYARFGD